MVELIRDPKKPMFKTSGTFLYDEDIGRILQQKGWIRFLDEGSVVLSGLFYKVFHYFHEEFQELVKEVGAEEILLPDFMSHSTIRDTNYINSFPQQSILAGNIELNVLQDNSIKFEPSVLLKETEFNKLPVEISYLLTPTVCFNIFEMWRGTRLQSDEKMIVASTKRCFRNECLEVQGLDRLTNFNMLEIVFCGPPKFVIETRADLLSRTANILLRNELIGEVCKGEDPFFEANTEGGNNISRNMIQKRFDIKYELNLTLPYENKPVAASSYNLHLGFFTKAFDIKCMNEKTLWSGCVGFGLERWALAFMAQHGPDTENWPLRVCEKIFK